MWEPKACRLLIATASLHMDHKRLSRPSMACASMLAKKDAEVANITDSNCKAFPPHVIKLTQPKVTLKGRSFHSKVPTATTLCKLQRLRVSCGSTKKSTKKHQYLVTSASCPLCTYCCFSFLFPTFAISNSDGLSFCLKSRLRHK